MADVRFMTLDPGHFHAGLVQKEMYPGVAPRVDVYAPLGGDLLGHLARINGFNSRADQPTAWRLEVHTGPDFFERMLAERPGNVVVISGRNRGKIDRIVPIGRRRPQRAGGQAVDSRVLPTCRRSSARSPTPTPRASSPTTS